MSIMNDLFRYKLDIRPSRRKTEGRLGDRPQFNKAPLYI